LHGQVPEAAAQAEIGVWRGCFRLESGSGEGRLRLKKLFSPALFVV
jgi:hypothetical protein